MVIHFPSQQSHFLTQAPCPGFPLAVTTSLGIPPLGPSRRLEPHPFPRKSRTSTPPPLIPPDPRIPDSRAPVSPPPAGPPRDPQANGLMQSVTLTNLPFPYVAGIAMSSGCSPQPAPPSSKHSNGIQLSTHRLRAACVQVEEKNHRTPTQSLEFVRSLHHLWKQTNAADGVGARKHSFSALIN